MDDLDLLITAMSHHQMPHHHCSRDAATCQIHNLVAWYARTITAQERPTATVIAASRQSLVARAPASDADRRRNAPLLPHDQYYYRASATLAHTPS